MRGYLRNGFIAVFLGVQLLLPLRFYACGDGYDERYAWRMFSPTRMVRCNPQFTADGRPVQLGTRYHQAWLSLARRGRRDVLEGIAADLCADDSIQVVKLQMTCKLVDGSEDEVSRGAFDLCELGGL